jgi:DNA-binding MarR family transcriptional regulator
MNHDLKAEIRQNKPFASLAQEAYLGLIRTASRMADRMDAVLRTEGLSAAQYNVLRILRGSEPNGLCRNELRDRLITRMPDVTRLLDRMEESGLVSRERSAEDRRMVTTRITSHGMSLLSRLDAPIDEEHERTLGQLSEDDLRSLIRILRAAREV